MKYFHILFALILFIIFSCEDDKNTTQYDINNEAEDYTIYQIVLMDRYGETNYHILLNDLTGFSELDTFHISNIKDKIDNILDETIDNYLKANFKSKKLKDIPGIDFYTFKSEYHGSYENTVEVYLSDVGYDNSMTQAILTLTESYNPGGGGMLIYLEKVGDKWMILYYYGLFIIG